MKKFGRFFWSEIMAWVLVPNFYFRWLDLKSSKNPFCRWFHPKSQRWDGLDIPNIIQPLQSLYPAKHILQLELSGAAAAPMTSQRDDLMQNSPNPSFQIYSFFHKLKVKSLLTSPASNHCNYKQFHLSTKGCTLFTEIKDPSNGAIFF